MGRPMRVRGPQWFARRLRDALPEDVHALWVEVDRADPFLAA